MAGVEFDENGDGPGRDERGEDLAERLLVIGGDCAAHLKESFRTTDHGEMLYDDHELPRF